jgi:predicted ribonuclease YlaK
MVIVDTNILMSEASLKGLFEDFDDIAIPVEVLAELDNLKTKEGDRGYYARSAIRAIKLNMDKIQFLIHEDTLSMTVDDIILAHYEKYPDATLVTNDISMEIKAKALGLKSINYYGKTMKRNAPVEKVIMTAKEYETFKKQMSSEKLDHIQIGQFAQLHGVFGEIFGTYRYLGPFMWDEVDPKIKIKNYVYEVVPRDIYQACAIKSLKEDEFTVITGPAGTGKTLLSLGYCLERMNKTGAVIHIFVNPVKTRDTQDLGYYPGSKDEKLLSNFIGGILSNKIGDITEVERLISQGGLRIYPFSDIRGVEIKSGDIMYITEAQNLSIDLIKLAIQRCADGSKLIIEGDVEAQVDKKSFEGYNNGLQRVIDVFTGTDCCDFGYINLPIIYRSRMAKKAEEL